MTKQEQKEVNRIVELKFDKFSDSTKTIISVKNLRYCDAMVIEYFMHDTGSTIYALKSYNTIVALIENNCIYDFLRMVYGYTATSAQHIAKFTHDYIDKYYDETKQFRYYPIGG